MSNNAPDYHDNLVNDLYAADKIEEGTALNALINDHMGLNDSIPEFD